MPPSSCFPGLPAPTLPADPARLRDAPGPGNPAASPSLVLRRAGALPPFCSESIGQGAHASFRLATSTVPIGGCIRNCRAEPAQALPGVPRLPVQGDALTVAWRAPRRITEWIVLGLPVLSLAGASR